MTHTQHSQALVEIGGQLARTQHFLGELTSANAYRNVRRKLPWLTREDFTPRYELLAAVHATAASEFLKFRRPSPTGYARFEDIDWTSLMQFLKRRYPTVPKRVIGDMLGMIIYLGYMR